MQSKGMFTKGIKKNRVYTDWILQLACYRKKRYRSVFTKALRTKAMLTFQLNTLA